MRILVTGASGRIGRAVYSRLSADHEVRGFDRLSSATADVVGDLTDGARVAQALIGVEAVIHVGGLHAPHVGIVPDAEFERVNVEGTRILLSAAARAAVRRIVYTSTTALYGTAATPPTAAGWVTEETVPAPRTIYHRTKAAAEALLKSAAEDGAISVTILRMSRCFPEPAPLMAAYRLHRGVDARDVADAHALAVTRAVPGHRTFIVSGSTPFLPEDAEGLLKAASQVLRRRAPELAEAFARRGWPLPASIDRVYCAHGAERGLGWRPKFGFAEVLKMLDERSVEVLPPKREWAA